MKSMRYLPGKLPNAALEKLLALDKRWKSDERILVGPQIGEDAAVIDFGDKALVVATDPITFATDQIGWYAVHVNANDVAVRGARPRWFLAVLLLPESNTDTDMVWEIQRQINAACAEIGCAVIGGHTEITTGLDRPLVVGQMLGEVPREKLVTTSGAKVGDAILLTKGIAIEGTAILAREREGELAAVPAELLGRAQDLLFHPGLGIVREALMANDAAPVHAMHDPTEGGLATGLSELAEAAGVGLLIERAAIPILPETAAICTAFGIDPLGMLASGALLIAVPPQSLTPVKEALERANITCADIGRVVRRGEGLRIHGPEGLAELPRFERDEIARVLG